MVSIGVVFNNFYVGNSSEPAVSLLTLSRIADEYESKYYSCSLDTILSVFHAILFCIN